MKQGHINGLKISAIVLLLLIAGCTQAQPTGPEMTIFKTQSCGCCAIYAKYAKEQGYDVKVNNVASLEAIKEKHKIPRNLQSCHTSEVGGYFVEGHIPNEAVQKLIAEKPDIAGIAMPGMPSGSPGMSGQKKGTWTIYAVHKNGTVTEFMQI